MNRNTVRHRLESVSAFIGIRNAAFDGNGNVAGLVNATNGTVSSQYEYGAFGEVIRATGPMASINPFRFSTQYYDDETDQIYYLRRYNNPWRGRWLSLDPIEELSFIRQFVPSLNPKFRYALQGRQPSANEFGFLQNDSVDQFDIIGLCPAEKCNKWTMTVILIRAVGIAGPSGVDVRATLTADKSCCMKEYSKYYRYLGYGLGIGVESTFNLKVGSHKIDTECIPWSAHNGIGRVTSGGVGIIWTYGLTYFTTPQAYFSILSGSRGFDAGVFTTAGWWWIEGNVE